MRKPKGCMCEVRPKTAETYWRNKRMKDGWGHLCKFCAKKAINQSRQKYPEIALGRSRKYNEEHPGRTRRYAAVYKQAWLELLKSRNLMTCHKCGYNEYFVNIHFHHLDPSKKEFGIARILNLPITDQRLKELNKTIPLCANCHGERHWSDKKEEEDGY